MTLRISRPSAGALLLAVFMSWIGFLVVIDIFVPELPARLGWENDSPPAIGGMIAPSETALPPGCRMLEEELMVCDLLPPEAP